MDPLSRRRRLSALLVPFLLTIPGRSSASWTSSPTANLPVITALSHQSVPAVCSDGADGSIIAWVDSRTGTPHVRVQRVAANGELAWTPDGLRVAQGTSLQSSPVILSDGAGGAIVSWVSSPGGQTSSYVQRISNTGALLWGSSGIKVTNGPGPQRAVVMASDGANGTILAGQSGSDAVSDIHAQRIDASGTIRWGANQTAIANQTGAQLNPQIVEDGAGGAIITWIDTRPAGGGIYAQRVDGAGSGMWTPVLLAPLLGDPGLAMLVTDHAGGAIVAWHDARFGNLDVFAQRLNPAGVPQWTAGGVAVCTAAGDQRDPRIETDGGSGAIVAWSDERGASSDIYAAKLSPAGATPWTAQGVAVCALAGDQLQPTVTRDGAGGAIFTWTDRRSGQNDLYTQHLDTGGLPMSTVGGIGLSTASGDQTNHAATATSLGGSIVVWEDGRSGLSSDIYAQHTAYLTGFCTGVTADLTADVTSGLSPLTVHFTNQSIGATQWAWDLDGDGDVDATVRNPTYVFVTPGVYSVSLMATNGVCSSGKTRAAYVSALSSFEGPSWVLDPHQNLPVATTPGVQSTPVSCSDVAGGTFIAWSDNRTGFNNIRIQHLDAKGKALLASGGVPLAPRVYNQTKPVIAPDGRGGAIVVWSEAFNDAANLYAERIDRSNQIRWGGQSSVCTASGLQQNVAILSDGFAGAFVAWEDTRPLNQRIFVQRMDSTGVGAWTVNGKPASSNFVGETHPRLASDQDQGAIVSWSDQRTDAGDVYASRFDRDGTFLWSDVAVNILPGRQSNQAMVSDGVGGVLLAWEDDRGGGSDIYGQRLGPNGLRLWTENGAMLCGALDVQTEITLLPDNAGGAIATWTDRRSGGADIFAQRINTLGISLWGSQGLSVCAAPGDQYQSVIGSDGAGGIVAAWVDSRSGIDLYVQRLNASGTAFLQANGGLLAGANGSQVNPTLTATGDASAIVAWEDTRTGARDIYAQHTAYTNGLCVPTATADFSADATSGEFPLTVHFADQSTGPVTSWGWDFESDGIIDDVTRNPTHVYANVGTYSVSLTVSDGSCPNVRTRAGYITVTPCLSVNPAFVTDTLGVSPYTAQFTDQSIGPVVSWQWDFENDGTIDATTRNPTHLYTVPGYYSVALTVSNGHCSSKTVRAQYVHVLPCTTVTVGFDTPDTTGGNPLTVHFSDRSAGPVNSWKWDFDNDGVIDATVQSPTHVYPNPGYYSVALTVSDGPCEKKLTRFDYIRVLRSYRDTLLVGSDHPANSDSARVPVLFAGKDAIGAMSIYLNFSTSILGFARAIPGPSGRVFTAGVTGGKLVLQWFDQSGANPIPAGRDTLCTVVFSHLSHLSDSTQIRFDQNATRLGDGQTVRLTDVTFLDLPPRGVVVFPLGPITGQVRHYLSSVAVPRASIVLTPPGSSTLSDANGLYSFPPPTVGRHVLRASKSDDLGGINSLDGLKILRAATGLETFTTNQVKAADVNLDGAVDALDAHMITRTSLGMATLVSGTWKILPDSIVIQFASEALNRDFTAIRYGDVNGDWTPGPEPFLVAAEGATPVRLWIPSTEVAAGGRLRAPLRVSGLDRAGALSLRLAQQGDALRFTSVTSAIEGLTLMSNRVGDELRVEWFDPTAGASPISIADGTLLTLDFEAVGAPGDSCSISIGAASGFGDVRGDPMPRLVVAGGRVLLTAPRPVASLFELEPVAPNPALGRSSFRFALVREARTTLGVYDVRGRLVRELWNGSMPAGEHALDFDARDVRGGLLSSGIYFVRLTSAGATRTRKFVLMP